jgi:hypothetical protein
VLIFAERDEIKEGWIVVWSIHGSTTEDSTDELASEWEAPGSEPAQNSPLHHSKRQPLTLVWARRSLVSWLVGERIASRASGEIK